MEKQRQNDTSTTNIDIASQTRGVVSSSDNSISEQKNGSTYPQPQGVNEAGPISLDGAPTDFVDSTTEVQTQPSDAKFIELPKPPKHKIKGLLIATAIALIAVALVALAGIYVTNKNADKLPVKSIGQQSANSDSLQQISGTILGSTDEQELIVNGDSTFNGDLTATNINALESLQINGQDVCTIDGCTIDESLLAQTVIEEVTNSVTVTTAGNELTIQGTTDQIIVTAAGDVITLSAPQNLGLTSSPEFVGLSLSGLNANGVVYADGSGTLQAEATGTPNLCLLSTAGAPTWGACVSGAVASLNSLAGILTIQGTANQVIVSDDGIDTITLSTPQDIHTTATPTFGGLTINGNSLFGPTLDAASIFEVQNQSDQSILSIDSTYDSYSNLVSNSTFESDPVGSSEPADWDALGSANLNVVSSPVHAGSRSMEVITADGVQNDGAKIPVTTFSTNTPYVLSMWIKASSGQINDLVLGFETIGLGGGDTQQDCSINHVTSGGTGFLPTFWTHFVCSFSTGSSLATDPYVYVRRTNSTLADGVTFYVDDVRLYTAVGNKLQIGNVGSSGTGSLSQLQLAYDGGGVITLQPVIGSGLTNNYMLTIPAESGIICTTANTSVCATGNDGRFLSKVAKDTATAQVASGGYLYTFTNSNSGVSSGVLKLKNNDNTGIALEVVPEAGIGIKVTSSAASQFAGSFVNSNATGDGVSITLSNASASGTALQIFTKGEPDAKLLVDEDGHVGIGESSPTAALYVSTPVNNDTVAFFTNAGKNGDILQLSNGTDTFFTVSDGKVVTLTLDSGGQLDVSSSGTGSTLRLQNSSSGAELAFNSTTPLVTIGNTGTLSITDGTNTLLSLADVSSSSTRLTIGVGSGTTTNGSIQLHNSTNAFTVTINAPNQITGSTTISIPNTGADTADTFCLQDAGNCVGVGGSISGSGTPGTIPVFTGTSAIGDSTLSESGGNLSATGDLTLQGGDITLGVASTTNGSLILQNSNNAFTTTISGANQTTGSATISLPDTLGVADTFCLFTLENCFGSGSGATLQAAYDAGNTITTAAYDAGRNIEITLANTTTDSDFIIDMLGTGNTFEVRDSGSPVLRVSDGGAFEVDGSSASVDVSGVITLNSDSSGINLTSGTADGGGGDISLTTGDGITNGAPGGDITLLAGDGGIFDVGFDANGGSINLTAGIGRGTGTAGAINITGGTHLSLTGGNVAITGGIGAISTASGGSVSLSGGAGGAAGACGTISCTATIQGGVGAAAQGAVYINHNATKTNVIRMGDGATAAANVQTIQIGSNGVTTPGTAVSGATHIYIGNSGSNSDISLYGGNGITLFDNSVLGDASSDTITVNGAPTFNTNVTATLAGTEKMALTSNPSTSNAVNVISIDLDNDTSSGIQRGLSISNASTGTGTTESLAYFENDSTGTVNVGLSITGTNTGTIIQGLLIQNTANTGSITTALAVSDSDIVTALSFGANDISGTNLDITGSTGDITTAGDINVNGDNINSDGATLTIDAQGTVSITDNLSVSGNILPEAASTRDLGSTSLQFDQLFLADDGGLVLGLNSDAELDYDEAGENRVELDGTGASLWIEDRLSLGRQTFTMSTAGAATENLTLTSSYVEITGQDNAADIAQIQTTGANEGDTLIITNISATDVSIDQNATTKLSGGADVLLTQYDVMMLIFDGANWLQVAAVTANS